MLEGIWSRRRCLPKKEASETIGASLLLEVLLNDETFGFSAKNRPVSVATLIGAVQEPAEEQSILVCQTKMGAELSSYFIAVSEAIL